MLKQALQLNVYTQVFIGTVPKEGVAPYFVDIRKLNYIFVIYVILNLERKTTYTTKENNN